MSKFNSCLILLTVFLASETIEAQSIPILNDEIAGRLDKTYLSGVPEIAYIQTSKDIYEAGEDLWFKVYLMDTRNMTPSCLSKTLYVQLLEESSKVPVWEEKLEIQGGIASGKAYIQSGLKEGNYLLAAYTTNSFYEDQSEFHSVKRISILNEIRGIKKSVVESTATPVKNGEIQFTTFPEGGELIEGIQGRLAFKGVNRKGEPVFIKGTLYEDNIPLLKFKSGYAGMGSLLFTPLPNRKYHIRLNVPAIDSSFSLSEIATRGLVMKLVERDKDNLTFRISQTQPYIEKELYLRISCMGQVQSITKIKSEKEIKVKIPLSSLPQGIAEVTLFNNELVPVAERLVYANLDRKLNITGELSKSIYSARGKATLKIVVKDEEGNPVSANLGISIFDKLYMNNRDSSNILSYYYLASQLKGKIFNPSFYFNSKSKGREEALDLLMLTQGWRKYIRDSIREEADRGDLKPVISDGVSGRLSVNAIFKSTRKEQTFVMSYSPNKDSISQLLATDSLGYFTITPEMLKGREDDYVYLKPLGRFPELISLNLDEPFTKIYQLLKLKNIVYPLQSHWNEELKIETLPQISMNRIKDVTIKSSKENTVRGKYMGTLDNMAQHDFVFHDYVCRDGIWNCPKHRGSGDSYELPEGIKIRLLMSGYDGVFICDGWEPLCLFAWQNIVAISPRVQFSEKKLLELYNLTRVKAYCGKRKFYQPDYDRDNGLVKVPDFRNTLLWDPEVITDEKGEASLNFYCSDINSEFVGRIEGMSKSGKLGAGYFDFVVTNEKVAP